jgi:DNA-binding NarL/FixJ family response regulator
MTTLPKLILADDHTLFAEMLAQYLGDTCDVIAIVDDGRKLVDAVKRHRPDVVIADLSMPGMGGLDALRRLRSDGVETRLIFLTMHADPALAAHAIKAGAAGYLPKNSAGDELTSAIASVIKGHTYLSPALAREALLATSRSRESTLDSLTTRQREVLSRLCQGRSVKEIAAEMQLSPRTVETHKYEMMHTLGVETTVELLRLVFGQGLAYI